MVERLLVTSEESQQVVGKTAVLRNGDRRRYRKWARANAQFDCRNGPQGFQGGSTASEEGA